MPDHRPAPTEFHAVSLHVGGPCFAIALTEDGLLRYHYEVDGDSEPGHAPIEIDIPVGAERWAELAAETDRIGVWSWHGSYGRCETPAKGQSWCLAIVWGDRAVRARGTNAYPGSAGSREPTDVFLDWCRAVRALVGGRPFA